MKEKMYACNFMQATRRSFLLSWLACGLSLRADETDSVRWLKTPESGLQPQAIVDPGGVLHIVYLYGDPDAADVGYVRKRPQDTEFSTPVRVNSCPGSAIALGTVRGARLALGANGVLHVAWNGSAKARPRGPGNSSPMLYTRLKPDGNTFEPERNLITCASGLDGGGAVAADRFGNVYVVWHARGMANGRLLEGEGNRRVWLARSSDGGASFQPEAAVSPADLGACGCCGLGAVSDNEGHLYVLFRTAREIVHRDMYLLSSRNRGETFRAVQLSPWQVGACPMSTVSLVSNKQRVLLSWEREGQVYFASLDGNSGAVGPIIAAPGSGKNRKHPAIAVNARDEILLAWTERTGWKKGGSLAWQLFDSSCRPISSGLKPAAVPPWGAPAAISLAGQFQLVC